MDLTNLLMYNIDVKLKLMISIWIKNGIKSILYI
jgi:hypothetical protein